MITRLDSLHLGSAVIVKIAGNVHRSIRVSCSGQEGFMMADYIPPGTHPNWCRCRGCRNNIARFEARQFTGVLIAAAIVIVLGLGWWLAEVIARSVHG